MESLTPRQANLATLLGALFLLSVVLNVAQALSLFDRPSEVDVGSAPGKATWVGRLVVNEEGDRSKAYELVRVDADGKEEIVYSGPHGPCDEVVWIETGGDDFTVKHTTSPCVDFAEYAELIFQDGKEVIRSKYRSNPETVMFEVLELPAYTITLVTSPECTYEAPSRTETQLLGVRVASDLGSEEFFLPQPQRVPCSEYDGSLTGPFLSNVLTSIRGIFFELPTGKRVHVSVDGDMKKVNVKFFE